MREISKLVGLVPARRDEAHQFCVP
jgi:hypothetical protein